MSGVILVSDSRDLARRTRIASKDDLLVLSRSQLPGGPAQLRSMTDNGDDVRVLIVDVSHDGEFETSALAFTARLEQSLPGVSVVLVSDEPERIGLPAMRAGARDVVSPGVSVEDLRWSLRRSDEVAAVRGGTSTGEEVYSGRVITAASPKGGVGKTTIATNLAAGLAAQSPQGTILVDLDLQFGDVAAALDLDPAHTLADVVSGPAVTDAIVLKTLLTLADTGLHVLPGAQSPADADGITGAQIGPLLDLLKREFRYVVVDTAPGLSEVTLAALDHTTDLVLVTNLDVPGVRGLRKELHLLDQLDLEPSTRHVVVNMADRLGGLTVSDVEATIGRKVDAVLPRSAKVVRSTNEGTPLVTSQPRDPVSRDLMQLVHRFSPAAAPSGALSGRLRGKVAR